MFNFFKKNYKDQYYQSYGKLWESDLELYYFSESNLRLFYLILDKYYKDNTLQIIIEKIVKILKANKAPYPKWVMDSKSVYHSWYLSFAFATVICDEIKIEGHDDIRFKNILNFSDSMREKRAMFITSCQLYIWHMDPRRVDSDYKETSTNIGPDIPELIFPKIDAEYYFPNIEKYFKDKWE